MAKITNPEIGRKALELRRQWRDHENDRCGAPNTLFAVFGVASKCGRIADKSSFNNNPYGMWLEDIAYDNGIQDKEHRRTALSEMPQSLAATEMSRNSLTRSNNRRVRMTKNARAALLSYFSEKITLLSTIDDFLTTARPRDLDRYRSQINRHKVAANVVINEVWASPPP